MVRVTLEPATMLALVIAPPQTNGPAGNTAMALRMAHNPQGPCCSKRCRNSLHKTSSLHCICTTTCNVAVSLHTTNWHKAPSRVCLNGSGCTCALHTPGHHEAHSILPVHLHSASGLCHADPHAVRLCSDPTTCTADNGEGDTATQGAAVPTAAELASNQPG
jgi:hypothetical protein